MKPDALSPWYRDLVVALRIKGASGREIGDAVAAVQSHCADSGDTPEGAFGTAQQYADALQTKDASKLSDLQTELTKTGNKVADASTQLGKCVVGQ